MVPFTAPLKTCLLAARANFERFYEIDPFLLQVLGRMHAYDFIRKPQIPTLRSRANHVHIYLILSKLLRAPGCRLSHTERIFVNFYSHPPNVGPPPHIFLFRFELICGSKGCRGYSKIRGY